MVSTQLKNISQIGNFPQIGVKIKNIWNHHLEEMDRWASKWKKHIFLNSHCQLPTGHQLCSDLPRCFPKVTVNAQAEKPGQHDTEPYLSGNQNQWCLMIFLFCLGRIWISPMAYESRLGYKGNLDFAGVAAKMRFLVVCSFPSNKQASCPSSSPL